MDVIFAAITRFFSQDVATILSLIFIVGGWIPLAGLILAGALYLVRYYKKHRYEHKWNWIVLAIDIPRLNVQTPKAVEQMFAHIFSVMENPSITTVYRRGFEQFSFSFEIISIGGYIQFLVRTLDIYRDVIEAAIYAQYPEAEVVEVEDYVNEIPDKYPNDTHTVWGADFGLTANFAYPIRLYREFEHSISKDTVLKDPMGTFLESFSRIGPGEQMWYQMIIEPEPDAKWKEECIHKIKELIGEKHGDHGGKSKIPGFLIDVPVKGLQMVADQLVGGGLAEGEAHGGDHGDSGSKNNLQFMTPGQKKLVEAMEEKIAKIGFKTKIRALYIARNEVFNPTRGVNSLIGAINQFNVPSSNSIVPKYTTSAKYFNAKKRKLERQRKIMKAYKKRSLLTPGVEPYVFNIEELATIWHFPMSHVKVPLLQKSITKKTEPPSDLPVETLYENELPTTLLPGDPQDRPYRTDSGDVFKNK